MSDLVKRPLVGVFPPQFSVPAPAGRDGVAHDRRVGGDLLVRPDPGAEPFASNILRASAAASKRLSAVTLTVRQIPAPSSNESYRSGGLNRRADFAQGTWHCSRCEQMTFMFAGRAPDLSYLNFCRWYRHRNQRSAKLPIADQIQRIISTRPPRQKTGQSVLRVDGRVS